MEKRYIKYPIGQQSFEQLRKGGFLYVDKSQYIERIINGYQFYFLGRPRRFGKSLFLSMLKCFFEGKRDLFKGLYIDSTDWKWEAYPVLLLDFNSQRYHQDDNLENLLENFLYYNEDKYGIIPRQKDFSIRFGNLIRTLAEKTGKSVVILVDEYDKPLVNNIHNRERFRKYRDSLASIYSNFKSSADYIRLVFLTGVSRFGKLSVFSDLNNISDISFDIEFSDICGITENEIKKYFNAGITSLAHRYNHSYEEELAELKKHYDGYHFSEEGPDIYNPFSLLQVMAKEIYDNFWIASGTPVLLAEQLRRTDTDLEDLLHVRCSRKTIAGLDIDNISPEALLYQTGYLTIKDYDSDRKLFQLGIPNLEVKEGFFEFLLPYYAKISTSDVKVFVFDFIDELESGRVDDFMKRLKSMFAGFSYDLQFDEERNVQNALLLLFTLVGMNVEAEVRTSYGRIDILVRTERYIYIMELKFDGSAEEALKQIIEKQYALPWGIDRRSIIEIGINYSSKKRCIDEWKFWEIKNS